MSDFRVIIVCVFPKKAKMLKHSGAFSPGTNRKRFIRRRKSIQLSVGIPGHRNSGGNSYWQRVSVGVGSILLRRISRLTFTPDGAMVSASNGGIQVWQRRGVFSRSRVIYYLRKSGDTLYYSPGKMKPRTGNAFRERLCRYVADDAELCRRIRSLDTWRDKTVLMLQEYHIGH